MAITRISIEDFLTKSAKHTVLDVRSPGEFLHAHIPGARSLPLFTDEERKVVGTAYKQEGREQAIKIGLGYFGSKMRAMVEEVEQIIGDRQSATGNLLPDKVVLVHCWRGGMRSAGVAWLLDLYGFEVYTLAGGYKTFRNWALAHFEKDYSMKVLGGYTGSGKTAILGELKKKGYPVIDLEGLANHKGSAFGGIGMPPQPSAEMFENFLAVELWRNQGKTFWVEDESQRIGVLNIPPVFWKAMRTQPLFFVEVPFHERLQYIIREYGKCDKERLLLSIERIQKRLGPLETKNARAHLERDEIELCFGILLLYYDKHYEKGLHNRENLQHLLNKIPCLNVDSITNTENLLQCSTANT
jgi:tRNA 2-selenouridine synthase